MFNLGYRNIAGKKIMFYGVLALYKSQLSLNRSICEMLVYHGMFKMFNSLRPGDDFLGPVNWVVIGWGDGLLPLWHQAIAWINSWLIVN